MEIRKLSRKDFSKAGTIACKSIGFDKYAQTDFEIALYSRFFWNEVICRATWAYGAYEKGRLIGVLLASFYDERPVFFLPFAKIIKKFGEWIISLLYKKAADTYEQADTAMFNSFSKRTKPDGEIVLFSVDPFYQCIGAGSALLNALASDEKDRRIFLYTDSGCNYQFYEHRGFTQEESRSVVLDFGERTLSMKCYVYSRIL